AEERARQAWNQKYSWAAAEGRQLRFHYLAGLRRYLDLLEKPTADSDSADPVRAWLRAEDDAAALAETQATWRARLDAVFPTSAWRDLEQQTPLNSTQDA